MESTRIGEIVPVIQLNVDPSVAEGIAERARELLARVESVLQAFPDEVNHPVEVNGAKGRAAEDRRRCCTDVPSKRRLEVY
ncbi:hypothetical protein RvY_11725 [Ramazzottius varieornatus]|uniref:Uncharacterized protein n=1 Tax=Ramazzottius varieornatus TaxID=947166 RepID=A0A1D1VLD9_RAMVA|nr:hypothetical protein RvY_11725 [Ramazzottius varieornatus]